MITTKSNTRAKTPIIPNYNRLAEIGGKHYSPEENQRIFFTILSAVRFMEHYEEPESNKLMIDTSRYSQEVTTEDCTVDPEVERIKGVNHETETGELITCPMCGRTVVKTAHRIYCSRSCSTMYHRKYG